jgi:hypothetical protein
MLGREEIEPFTRNSCDGRSVLLPLFKRRESDELLTRSPIYQDADRRKG